MKFNYWQTTNLRRLTVVDSEAEAISYRAGCRRRGHINGTQHGTGAGPVRAPAPAFACMVPLARWRVDLSLPMSIENNDTDSPRVHATTVASVPMGHLLRYYTTNNSLLIRFK